MSGRAQIIIKAAADRKRASEWIWKAKPGTRVEFKGPQRTIEQNDRMWAMLTDVALQHAINGQKYSTDAWKVMFITAWAREVGREVQYLPALDGGPLVPYGQSSSDLEVPEMTSLIEWIFAWGAENAIVWSDPKERRAREEAAA